MAFMTSTHGIFPLVSVVLCLLGGVSAYSQDATITEQPSDVTLTEGDTLKLSVGAAGQEALTYQWYYQASEAAEPILLPGQTQATLTINNVRLDQQGLYAVLISDSVESRLAVVVVKKKTIPLAITQQPVGTTIDEGASLRLSGQAQGEAPLRFQWFFSATAGVKPSTALLGAVSGTFTVNPATPAYSGFYLLRVTDALGSIDSAVVQVTVKPKPNTPGMLADNGFRPERDGFSFENYGNSQKPVNLTAVEIRRLFGDRACATINGNVCILTPPGKKWLEQQSEGMDGGHCEGMAVASVLMFSKHLDVKGFGADTTFALDIQSTLLQREIGLWFVTQFTSPTTKTTISGTPVEIVDRLIQVLKPGSTETYTVGVYAPPPQRGGHAVTPYAVQDMGNNIYNVLVYDNNHPGKTRRLIVDRTKNTWELSLSTKPSEEEKPWWGNASSKSFEISPSSPRTQIQDCPFCEETTAESAIRQQGLNTEERYSEIYVEGNGVLLLITDPQGKRYGYANGTFFQDIPGVKHRSVKGNDSLWKDNLSPIFFVPVGMRFKLTLDGSNVAQPTESSVTFIGPGYDLAVDHIMLDPGQMDTIEFSADGTGVSYTSSGNESPDITLGFEARGADFEFTVKGVETGAGATISLKVDEAKGTLSLSSSGNTQAAFYALAMGRFDEDHAQEFFHDEIALAPKDAAIVEFGKWGGEKATLPLLIDRDNNGSIDQQIDLTDEEEPGVTHPKLHAMAEASGRVRISWTDTNSSLVLESTTALGSVWSLVPAAQIVTQGASKSFTDTSSTGAKFYRLRMN